MAATDFIEKLTAKQDLEQLEAETMFLNIVKSGYTPAQIAATLIALKMKPESVTEIVALATVLRAKSEKFEVSYPVFDNCGTGGDKKGTYNISTAVAFVLAGAGVKVAKHGNKAVSSMAGSSDVLSELGIKIDAEKNIMQKSLDVAGIAFLLAPKYHNLMRYVAPTRKELGVRTIFNIVGPLTNPASPKRQIIGVFGKGLCVKLALALKELGAESAWVVHGSDGMDEITTTSVTYVAALNKGVVETFIINPSDYGIALAEPKDLEGGDVAYNARALREVILGKGSRAYLDIVLLNSAAALVVAGKVADIGEGMLLAQDVILSKKANDAFLNMVEITNEKLDV